MRGEDPGAAGAPKILGWEFARMNSSSGDVVVKGLGDHWM